MTERRIGAGAWGVGLLGLALAGFGCDGAGSFLVSEQQEIEVGAEVDQVLREEYQVCTPDLCDPRLLQWIDELGQEMAAVSARPQLPYTFTVLHSDQINAFAAPGGYIYFTTGLLRAATSTAEVAGVLGHEIGHVVERHGAQAIQTQVGLSLLEELFLGTEGAASQVARILVGSYQSFVASKDKELEADRQGVILTNAVNISPNGLVSFFETLQAAFGDPDRISQILSSHPAPAERITHAQQLISEMNIDAAGMPRERDPVYTEILTWLPPPAGDGP